MSDISQANSRLSRPFGGKNLDLAKVLLEGRAFFALIVIIVVFSILSPNYFTVSNFLTMANHVAIYGLLSIGMLLVILNGGIDLSVGSVLALSGVVAGALMQGVTLNALGVVLFPPVWAVVVLTWRSAPWSARSTARWSPSSRCRPSSPRWARSMSPAASPC